MNWRSIAPRDPRAPRPSHEDLRSEYFVRAAGMLQHAINERWALDRTTAALQSLLKEIAHVEVLRDVFAETLFVKADEITEDAKAERMDRDAYIQTYVIDRHFRGLR